jgi:hypothetical protein
VPEQRAGDKRGTQASMAHQASEAGRKVDNQAASIFRWQCSNDQSSCRHREANPAGCVRHGVLRRRDTQRRNLGSDPAKAQGELNHQIRKLADKSEGRPVIEDPNTKRHSLEIAVSEYFAHLRRKEREEKTIRGIEQVLDVLVSSTGRVYVEDLKHSDITEKFVSALKAEGYAKQTVFDRFARVVSFLKFCDKRYGCPRVVELKDAPPRPKPRSGEGEDGGKKDPYTEQELSKLFAASTPEERLLWKFFLDTGEYDRVQKPESQSCLDIHVSKELLDRALAVMNTILASLDSHGIQVKATDKATFVEVFGETVRFGVEEDLRLKERREEKQPYGGTKTVKVYERSGTLAFQIWSAGYGARRHWGDGKKKRLEELVPKCLGALLRTARQNRLEAEERQNRQLEWERQRREREERVRKAQEEEEHLVAHSDVVHAVFGDAEQIARRPPLRNVTPVSRFRVAA